MFVNNKYFNCVAEFENNERKRVIIYSHDHYWNICADDVYLFKCYVKDTTDDLVRSESERKPKFIICRGRTLIERHGLDKLMTTELIPIHAIYEMPYHIRMMEMSICGGDAKLASVIEEHYRYMFKYQPGVASTNLVLNRYKDKSRRMEYYVKIRDYIYEQQLEGTWDFSTRMDEIENFLTSFNFSLDQLHAIAQNESLLCKIVNDNLEDKFGSLHADIHGHVIKCEGQF